MSAVENVRDVNANSNNDDIQAYLSSLVDPREIADIEEAERDVLGVRLLPIPRQGFQRGDSKTKETAIKGVKDALLDLPNEKTRAYYRAMELDKDLVELESPIERFLLAVNYNYWEAADKLAEYWNLRFETFGERYHLPLRLDGSGALSSRAALAFKNGLFSFKPYPDEFNRLVIVFDAEYRNEAMHDLSLRKEISFYTLHVASEFDFAVANGYVLLMCQGTNVTKSNPAIGPNAEGFRIISSGIIPTRPKAVHIIVAGNGSTLMKATIRTWMSALRMNPILGLRIRAHFSEEDPDKVEEAMVDEMESYGIHREHLPRRYGGLDDGRAWYRERLQTEAKRYSTLQRDNTGSVLDEEREICSSDDEESVSIEDTQETKITKNLDLRDTATQSYSSRDKFLKRKMEEICLYHKDRNLRRKVAQLQERADELRLEQTILQAKIGCSEYLARQFFEDTRRIKLYLLKHWVKPLQNPETDNAELNAKLLDIYMSTLFHFHGRSNAGTFFFSKGIVQLAPDVLPGLGNLFELIKDLGPHDVYADLNYSKVAAGSEDPSDEAALARKVETLQREKAKLTRDNAFLEGSLLLSDEFAKVYDTYKAIHAGTFAKSIGRIFTRLTRHPASILETHIPDDDPSAHLLRKCRPLSVAGRLIDRIWFLGCERTCPQFPSSQLEAMIRDDGFILPRQNSSAQRGNSSAGPVAVDNEYDEQQFPFLKRRATPSNNDPVTNRRISHSRRSVRGPQRASTEDGPQRRQLKVYRRRKPNLQRL